MRDLKILGQHFSLNPGRLNVRRGKVSKGLYRKRINTVVQKLSEAGVDTKAIEIRNGLPGGDGMTSEETSIIVNRDIMGQETSDNSSRTRSSMSQSGE